MPKKVLLKVLAETSGYCCQWAYVSLNLHKTKRDWAKETGVCAATVQESRSQCRDGVVTCQKLDGCIEREVRAELRDLRRK